MTDHAVTTPSASGIGAKICGIRQSRSGLRASLTLAALLSLAQGSVAFAATAPALGTNAPFGVVASTLSNTTAGTSFQGNVCYTTGPGVAPAVFGTVVVPCDPQNGADFNTALADINGQACTSLGGAVDLALNSGGGGRLPAPMFLAAIPPLVPCLSGRVG